jgi:hypothetical protein
VIPAWWLFVALLVGYVVGVITMIIALRRNP